MYIQDTNDVIDEYLSGAWWVKDNANIPFSIMSLNNKLAEKAHKRYWLTKVYTDDVREAYKTRLFHIHNLGHLTTYCVGWDTEEILLRGFKGQPGRQSSRPPKHFRAALGQVYNFLYTLQGEAAGAEALNNFDTYLAPFIAYDNLDQGEVDQCIQEFVYNMNVPTRVGGQQPFTNITLDQTVPKHMAEENAIRGGKADQNTYADYQDEMDMLNAAWWKQRIAGDADGRPQPFPIETLNVTKDFNFEDELLFKAVALRGAPYFANYANELIDMSPEDARSMCCRIRIDNRELVKRGGGFFGAHPLTGSIGVVTMNMPLIAYLTKDEDTFFELLGDSMDIAKDTLQLKRDFIEGKTSDTPTLYPYSKLYLDSVHQRFGKYWMNHFSTIGLVGMNEACLNLFGEGIQNQQGLDFSIKTLNFMRDKALQYQEETDNMFNIEATPAETTSFDLALADKKQFRMIKTSGTKKVPYYTNSTQLPVGLEESLGFFLNHQNNLQKLYTGGTVFHIWNGENQSYWEGVAKLLQRSLYNTQIPYMSYTPTTSVCQNHGLMSGEFWTCPTCGLNCEVWSRVTGYFSPISRWNDGKRQEFRERTHFSIG